MKKSIYCLITASALLVTLCSCSVLPKPDDTSPTPSSTTEPAVSTSDANGATQSEVQEISAGTSDLYDKLKATYDAEKATKLLIKTVRLQTQVNTLMQMQPMMTAEEKAKAEIETAKQTPYTEVSADLTSYCHKQTEYAMQEFFNDYTGSAYEENEDNRLIYKIYSGENEMEINGGLTPKRIGTETGYWRITNCSYYNSVFFTNGKNNIIKSLFRCTAYHYTLNDTQDNLAQDNSNVELTTENSTVTEFDNVFLVVTQKDVRPADITADTSSETRIDDVCLMFSSYDSAMDSFTNPKHTFESLYVGKEYSAAIMDGYQGKPVVAMPSLIGKYIDVSKPTHIKELDDLNITNYEVVWQENDGSQVPYSILACSKEPGSAVDITDTSADSKITVTVAAKVPDTSDTDTTVDEGDSQSNNSEG